MWLEFLEQNIRWNLEEDIWNEEDGECDVGFVAFEVYILRHMKREGIADIDAVQEGCQVENKQYR